METLFGLGVLWVAGATALTLALGRLAGAEEPFGLDRDGLLTR